jgi:hypothetical protein
MPPFMSSINSSAIPRPRHRARTAVLSALALAGAIGPAQAMGRPEPPDSPVRTVYRATRAYSSPYLSARRSHPVRPGRYVVTCEVQSGSAPAPHNNPWWSRTNEGTWINNGDFRGGIKMNIGDCPTTPGNDSGHGN